MRPDLTSPQKAPPPAHNIDRVSLYIHVPFCRHLCPYCAFYKQENPTETMLDSLVNALATEIGGYRDAGLTLSSIFWGGGTPTLLQPRHWDHMHKTLSATFHIPKGTEHTVEVNPETVSPLLLTTLHEIGVTRLSIGVQSFSDRALAFLGRRHGQTEVRQALDHVFAGPIQTINLDLMYGLPEEVGPHVTDDINTALSYPIAHLSTYALTIEPGTPFAKTQVVSPENKTWAEYIEIRQAAKHAGLIHYEISAFAKPGHTCTHNMAYWRLHPYIGIGPSASSYWRGIPYKNPSDVARYVQNPNLGASQREKHVSMNDFCTDYMLANFRRLDAVDLHQVSKDLGIDAVATYGQTLADLAKNGFVHTIAPHLYQLTEEGIRMHNDVLEKLV